MEMKKRVSLVPVLLILLASVFLLSVLPNVLTEYPRPQPSGAGTPTDQPGNQTEVPVDVLFTVSPAAPQLFWRVSTADYYTGFNWLMTTDDEVLGEFPQLHDSNATRVFTVEINSSRQEILLPVASPDSVPANMSWEPGEGLKFYVDNVGGVYKARLSQAEGAKLAYKVAWYETDINESLVSLDEIPQGIAEKYLQLPDLSGDVWNLAEALRNPYYSILDQILADVQYFRTNFVYDTQAMDNLRRGVLQAQGSDVSYYITSKKGICIDAATALAIILRIQKIPARISFGYNPGTIEGGKLLYDTTRGHSVTEVYLPPYGWVQFDATPPLEEVPLVNVLSFKKESSPGSTLFYQISIRSRSNETDEFRLFVNSKRDWNVSVFPQKLRLEASQTADALLEIMIPENANPGEKDMITVTVASQHHPNAAFSALAITQVGNIPQISTTTTIRGLDEETIRADTFWVNGTVLTANDEQVNNMTVFILLTKTKEAEGVIVGKGQSEQGHFEIESTVPYYIEIGDYNVVPISLGTAQLVPSSSHGSLSVRATTAIELGSEDEFLVKYGTIHGHLYWDNGTGVANQPVSLDMTSLNGTSEVWRSQNVTLEDGSFRVEITFENPGTYEAKATFAGDEHVIGATATRVVEFKLGTPALHISGEKMAIRSEVFDITGTVQFGNIGIWGEPVTLTFDNKLLETVETSDNGSYRCSFVVDPNEKLGVHVLTATLGKADLHAVHQFTIKSKTTLVTKVTSTAGGMFLLVSASLYDDHNLPIDGAKLSVDTYGLSWITKQNQNSTFLLDTIKLWPEDTVLTTTFEGSELYLPSLNEKEVPAEPIISLPFALPLISPVLTVLVFLYARHILGTKKMLRRTSALEVVMERVETAADEHEKETKTGPFKLYLPDVPLGFPNVWGVEEELRVQMALDESALKRMTRRSVDVSVNEHKIASVGLTQQGRAEISHTFMAKGEYLIRATLSSTEGVEPCDAEIKVRAVDYPEEIVRLYNKFLEKLFHYDVNVGNELTAREIESLVLERYEHSTDFSPDALRRVTACFERAEYSNRSATRKDYETLFLSLEELHVHVG